LLVQALEVLLPVWGLLVVLPPAWVLLALRLRLAATTSVHGGPF